MMRLPVHCHPLTAAAATVDDEVCLLARYLNLNQPWMRL